MLVQEGFRINGPFYSREPIVYVVPKNNCHATCLFYEYIGELFLTLFWFLCLYFLFIIPAHSEFMVHTCIIFKNRPAHAGCFLSVLLRRMLLRGTCNEIRNKAETEHCCIMIKLEDVAKLYDKYP